ncbi:beta-ketoacyl synthase N-terminal-like domain-containing protein [Trichloromonas sp.]|uniref:beta-ketoacyl synthase N-terminal-like domain-containing protein n=1 Tax=Trichloromonas sp. TaxID=3069249 RepID=UPI003D815A46
MEALSIQGIGVVGGFGCGVSALRQALQEGRQDLQPVRFETAAGPIETTALLADTTELERFVNKRALRRIDHFSRLTLLGAHLALEDAGLLGADRKRLGMVIATGYGATRTTFAFLDSVMKGSDILASPTHFSSSVHNAAAAHASILLEATGPSLTVSQFEMSVPSALLTARQWLAEKRVDAVLFGGVDESCEVMHYCWQRFFAETPSGRIRPFEFDAQSAVVGEGAAFLLLTRKEGDAPGYASIDAIRQGNCHAGSPELPAAGAYLLGADGHRECAAAYGRHLPADAPAVSYAPLYGSLPVGPAFDLAIAAVSCRDNRLYPGPQGASRALPASPESLLPQGLCCLKFGPRGDYGWIRVRKD